MQVFEDNLGLLRQPVGNGAGMVYALTAIGLVIGLFIWSMCRIGARYDEHFERLDQREQHSCQCDLTGTDE